MEGEDNNKRMAGFNGSSGMKALQLLDVLGVDRCSSPSSSTVLVTHLLSDMALDPSRGPSLDPSLDPSLLDPSELSSRWALKERPEASANNMRIDNIEECVDEIACVNGIDELLLLDLSSLSTGRNIDGLRTVAKRLSLQLSKKVSIYYSTSPLNDVKQGDDSSVMSRRMKSELFGGHCVSADLHIKAVAVSHTIGTTYLTVDTLKEDDISDLDLTALEACGKLHKDLEGTSVSAVASALPPIIISTSPGNHPLLYRL